MGDFRGKANWALGLVTAGYLASYPFSNGVVGGMICSTCGAAMVGGIADWFAVTALFRRPLGIPWRTEIIPRNRDKLLNIITDMLEKELLSSANLRQTLERYDLAGLLVNYTDRHGGREQVQEIIGMAIMQLVNNVDKEELSRSLELVIRRELGKLELAPHLAAALEWSLASGYGEKLIDFILAEARVLVAHEQVERALAQVIASAQAEYERNHAGRRFFNSLAQVFMDLTPAKAAGAVQRQLLTEMATWREPEHEVRRRLRQSLYTLAGNLRYDDELKNNIETWKNEYLLRPEFIRRQIFTVLSKLLSEERVGQLRERLQGMTAQQVDVWLDGVRTDEQKQQQIDAYVRTALVEWVDGFSAELAVLARRRVAEFSGSQLAEFVEQRAGNDLQIIRINGSVVGGILGLIIHIATWWLR